MSVTSGTTVHQCQQLYPFPKHLTQQFLNIPGSTSQDEMRTQWQQTRSQGITSVTKLHAPASCGPWGCPCGRICVGTGCKESTLAQGHAAWRAAWDCCSSGRPCCTACMCRHSFPGCSSQSHKQHREPTHPASQTLTKKQTMQPCMSKYHLTTITKKITISQ